MATALPVVTQAQRGRHADAAVDRTPPGALRLLFAGLVLFAAFGKGFAYAGVPPLFVGEALLAVVLVAAVRSSMALPRHPAASVTAVLAGIAAVQLAVDRLVGDAPLLETLRGLAPVYYSGYAFGLYVLLRAWESRVGPEHIVESIDRALVRVAPAVITAVLVLAALLLLEPTGLPTWPTSGVQILLTKSGDVAVTLVLFAPVVARRMGLHRLVVGAGWCTTALLVSFRSRGALLALAIGLVVAWPHAVRIAKLAFVAVAVVLLLYVTGLSVEVGGREISYEGVGDAAASVLGGKPEGDLGSNYVGTTNWRADWWRSIWDDVTSRRMVLHGTGWGDNLAVRYGVVPPIDADDPRVLRLPHSIFFSLAGRAGLLVAVAFLAVPVLTVATTYRSRPRDDLDDLAVPVQGARGAIAAAVTTGLADIYLESPQGGILLWSLVGFLWWATATRLDSGSTSP
jgi:O-antigen ligase/polysaccharide polymerase Wzy-like membrane protein